MSTQGQPPKSSDGQSDSLDNPPEGILFARYHMDVMISANLLRCLEKIAWKFGVSRDQFDREIFARGIDALYSDMKRANNDDFQAEMAMIAPLGRLLREKSKD